MMSLKTKPLIVIVGTTGVGKSKFSIDLARNFNGEIINADSMQMYKGCPIITNKHPLDQREGIPHHVMDHVEWDQEYYIHRFQSEALKKISEIRARDKVPIVVGGTNYYLQSLLFNERVVRENKDHYEDEKQQEDSFVSKTEQTLQFSSEQQQILNMGFNDLHNQLALIDPQIAHKFHPRDKRRVKRMLEIYFSTGKLPSQVYKDQNSGSMRFNTLVYWLWSEPSSLFERLDSRVDDMFAQGALEEIQQLYSEFKNQKKHENQTEHGIYQVIGFKEFLPWLEKKASFEECLERMKQKTQSYSKAQVKWIKNVLIKELASANSHVEVHLLDVTDLSQWQQMQQKGFDIYSGFDSRSGVVLDVPKTFIPLNETESKDWKQYECDICVDKDTNEPLILVGDSQWKVHLSGRRHRGAINRREKRRKYEDYLRSKQENSG